MKKDKIYLVKIECLGKSGTEFPFKRFLEAYQLFEQFKNVAGEMTLIQRSSDGDIILNKKEA